MFEPIDDPPEIACIKSRQLRYVARLKKNGIVRLTVMCPDWARSQVHDFARSLTQHQPNELRWNDPRKALERAEAEIEALKAEIKELKLGKFQD